MFSKRKTNKELEREQEGQAQPQLRDENVAEASVSSEAEEPVQEMETEVEVAPEVQPEEESTEDQHESQSEAKPEEKETEATASEIERAYCLGAGIDEVTFAKAKEILEKMAECVYGAKFNPEGLGMALKVLNYDAEVEKAREEGLTLGRSECIAEVFRNRRKAAEKAAEVPHFRGAKGMGSPFQGGSIFDVARDAK